MEGTHLQAITKPVTFVHISVVYAVSTMLFDQTMHASFLAHFSK